MSEISEVEAGMELAIEAARRLFQVCPDHELLDLFKGVADDDFNDKTWDKFQVRFGKEGLSKEERAWEPAQAYFWANYFVALKKACKENGIDV